MNADQLWETTLDREARSLLQVKVKVKVKEADEADDIFVKLMGRRGGAEARVHSRECAECREFGCVRTFFFGGVAAMSDAVGGGSPSGPRCNRVTPFGKIVASPSRGAFMGNRGPLLAPDGTLGSRRWTTKRWVCCRLEFRGWRVPVWQPGRYTPLFFFDEAVALAAGHRPCGECRRDDLASFKQAWQIAHGRSPEAFVSTDEIDEELHAARVDRRRDQVTFSACAADLPDGVLVARADNLETAFLHAGESLRSWSFDGYGEHESVCGDERLTVLTPRPTMEAIRAGYVPIVGGRAARESVSDEDGQ